MQIAGMFSRQHSQDVLDLVICLASSPQEWKQVILLVNDVERQITVQKLQNVSQCVFIKRDSFGQFAQSLADGAMSVVLSEEPYQRFPEQLRRHGFNKAALINRFHRVDLSLPDPGPLPGASE